MAKQASRVVQDLMDEPHIAGHRVSVRRLRALVEERGLEPRTVADSLDLDVADVYRALTYYHDNPGEMHDLQQRRTRRIEASRDGGAPTGPEDL
ncbi:MAG: DUF433 domain-containing protein [Haloarculaceae archaeon]